MNYFKQKGFTIIELLFSLAFIAGFIGWIMNIVDIVHAIHNPITLMLILRMVGIFIFPLGMVLGYC